MHIKERRKRYISWKNRNICSEVENDLSYSKPMLSSCDISPTRMIIVLAVYYFQLCFHTYNCCFICSAALPVMLKLSLHLLSPRDMIEI